MAGLGLKLKRALDVVGAGVGLAATAPVLALAAGAIAARMGRPILFRQARVGLGGRTFTILKFRSMGTPSPGEAAFRTDADRLTPLGRVLRVTSIDELPQLWNVLRGEMSLVGPRPLLPEYLGLYTERQQLRHGMKPGMTGLAQIQGRQNLPVSARLEYDVRYVEQWSLGLDLWILAKTVAAVLSAAGVDPDQPFAEVDDMGFTQALAEARHASSAEVS